MKYADGNTQVTEMGESALGFGQFLDSWDHFRVFTSVLLLACSAVF